VTATLSGHIVTETVTVPTQPSLIRGVVLEAPEGPLPAPRSYRRKAVKPSRGRRPLPSEPASPVQ